MSSESERRTVKAVLVRPDGETAEVDFPADENPYFAGQRLIHAHAELVKVARIGDAILHLIVDEEGHLHNLAYNEKASQFYPAPASGLPPGDPPIVGDVLFVLMELQYDPEPDWKPVDLNTDALAYMAERGVTV